MLLSSHYFRVTLKPLDFLKPDGVSCRGHSGGRERVAVGGRPALCRVRVTFAAWLPQGAAWQECRERAREVGVSEAQSSLSYQCICSPVGV